MLTGTQTRQKVSLLERDSHNRHIYLIHLRERQGWKKRQAWGGRGFPAPLL